MPSGAASMKAIWNDEVIAESDDTVVVEGNHYFPMAALRGELLRDSETTSICPWKGTARYFDLAVAGQINRDAVWYYPEPKPAAQQIAGRCAFWHGVKVVA
jgi:uncharacterized protein (DUF427 family)